MSIDRGQFIEEMKVRGIGTSVHFIPVHLQPFYQQTFGTKPGDYPVDLLPTTHSEYGDIIRFRKGPTVQGALSTVNRDTLRENSGAEEFMW